jgi:hypothetical protein
MDTLPPNRSKRTVVSTDLPSIEAIAPKQAKTKATFSVVLPVVHVLLSTGSGSILYKVVDGTRSSSLSITDESTSGR